MFMSSFEAYSKEGHDSGISEAAAIELVARSRHVCVFLIGRRGEVLRYQRQQAALRPLPPTPTIRFAYKPHMSKVCQHEDASTACGCDWS